MSGEEAKDLGGLLGDGGFSCVLADPMNTACVRVGVVGDEGGRADLGIMMNGVEIEVSASFLNSAWAICVSAPLVPEECARLQAGWRESNGGGGEPPIVRAGDVGFWAPGGTPLDSERNFDAS